MSNEIAYTSLSFFVAGILLTLFVAYSFFSPLALGSDAGWEESVLRAAAHFLPVLPPLIVGLALRYGQVWSWYVGVFYMALLCCLGVYLSLEHFTYLVNGYFILPTFLLLSLVSIPSLILLFRRRCVVLKQLRREASGGA